MPEGPQVGVPTLQGQRLLRTFGEGETLAMALAEVSIELYRGELALLMGPSGSGKSTLLAVLSGLLRPTSGQVTALGQDLWKMSDRQRERFRLQHCGFIFQGYNLFPALTAREQLEMVLRWGGGTSARAAREQADQTLALLGLARKAHLRPQQMSGGEKQRVAIGRALIKKPTFCFADEPTGALDWAHGEQVIELLRNAAHDRGATILVVAHDARIIPYADRVFRLEDGRLCESDETPVDATSQAGVPSRLARAYRGKSNGQPRPPSSEETLFDLALPPNRTGGQHEFVVDETDSKLPRHLSGSDSQPSPGCQVVDH